MNGPTLTETRLRQAWIQPPAADATPCPNPPLWVPAVDLPPGAALTTLPGQPRVDQVHRLGAGRVMVFLDNGRHPTCRAFDLVATEAVDR